MTCQPPTAKASGRGPGRRGMVRFWAVVCFFRNHPSWERYNYRLDAHRIGSCWRCNRCGIETYEEDDGRA